jgi:hypothetical protein
MLLEQFNKINKKKNEIVKEFDAIFDKLYDHISTDLHTPTIVINVLYMNAFEGQFAFILIDKAPNTLEKAKEYSTQIKENIISSRIDPFHFPHVKVEEKTKTATNTIVN